MAGDSRTRILAAPRLGDEMGGVAQVSRLAWLAIERRWGTDATLVTLMPDGCTLPSTWDKLRFGTRVAQAQRSGALDWILFMHLGLARVQRRVPRGWQSPFGVFLHGVEAWAPLTAPDRALLRAASLRIANSTFTARMVRQANPGIGEIVVCPLALEPDREWAPRGRERAVSQQVLVVGRMATGERYKGHEQLIEVWPSVLESEPDAELVIVGDGDDRQRLEEKARSGGASRRIRFTGFLSREALAERYAAASVFALPSRGEGFGVVYLEAMANGLPCVGSKGDAAGEVIVDGVTGLLIDPEQPATLRAALVQLLCDRALRCQLGEAGRARLSTHFTFARFHDCLTDALQMAFEPATTHRRPQQPAQV